MTLKPDTATATAPAFTRETFGARLRRFASAHAGDLRLLAAIVILAVIFGFKTDRFFTTDNLRVIANQLPALALATTGVTFALISGGVDLSVGSVLALSSAVMGLALSKWGWPLAGAAALAPLVGFACGALSGAIIVGRRLPSFIITLGMLEMARGAVFLLTDSRTQYLGPSVRKLAEPVALGLSLLFFIALGVAALAQWTLSATVFGRWLMATGRNEQAAHWAGAPTGRVRAAAFAISGLMAGLAGLAQTARLGSSNPNVGLGFELEALAAAVIGGVSLSGGRGSIYRALLGVIFISMLGSGLAQIGAQESTKRLVTGAVLVLAIIFDSESRER